jgi:tripartite-type tricarboxylate transporter receptor subunit TctC
MADLLGGHVKLMMDSTAAALNHIRDGRIKAFAVTTARPAPAPLDNIPPIARTLPGFDAAGWSGLAAPARTPPEIVARISADMQKLLNDPEIVKQIEARAALAAPGGPAEFSAFIKKEIDTWGEVVRATGTKPGT